VSFFAIGFALAGMLSALFVSGEFAVELFFTLAASSVLVVLIIRPGGIISQKAGRRA
jgi:hypothetical protein